MTFPKKTKELTWSKLGQSYVLVDPETKKNYNVDVISFLVWIQCDGTTSVDDIVEVFSVDGNEDIVKAAIKGVLDKLEKSNLINWI